MQIANFSDEVRCGLPRVTTRSLEISDSNLIFATFNFQFAIREDW
jgi:hypothetical protein